MKLSGSSERPFVPLSKLSHWGLLYLIIGAVLGIIAKPFEHRLTTTHPATESVSNIKQTALALLQYADDNNDRLPYVERWMDAITPFVKSPDVFQLAIKGARQPGPHFDIAMRTKWSGIRLASVDQPDREVLIFGSKLDLKNQHGGAELLLASDRRTRRMSFVGFMDSHVKALRPERAKIAFRGETIPSPEASSGSNNSNGGQ